MSLAAARAACCARSAARARWNGARTRREPAAQRGRARRRCARRRGSARSGRASPRARRRRTRARPRLPRSSARQARGDVHVRRSPAAAPAPNTCARAVLDDRQAARRGCGARHGAMRRARGRSRAPGGGGRGTPLSFRRERVAVDQREHAQRRGRAAQQRAARVSGRRRSVRASRRTRAAPSSRLSMCTDSVSPGAARAPGVALVHAHERRDVQRLVELAAEHAAVAARARRRGARPTACWSPRRRPRRSRSPSASKQ